MRTRGLGARRGSAGLEHDNGLLPRDAAGHLGERAAVLEVLAMLGDDLGVVVLLEKGEQIVLVDVALVAEADDRRDSHLGRATEADDSHTDAARLGRQRS